MINGTAGINNDFSLNNVESVEDTDYFLDIDFSFDDFLDTVNENINEILDKYGIGHERSDILGESDYINYNILISYIYGELYAKGKEVPADIKEVIKKDNEFRKQLLKQINKELNVLTTDDNKEIFQEINTLMDKLSLGEKVNIIETYNTYNFEEIEKLFSHYIDDLTEVYNEEGLSENFDSLFELYTCLIELLNKICFINSTDIERKKIIYPIIDKIKETIHILKFNIPLKQEHHNLLNNTLGKVIFLYSHIQYVDTKNMDLGHITEKFFGIIDTQIMGFEMSQDTNFANNKKEEKEGKKMFIKYMSYSILTMLSKLEKKGYSNDEIEKDTHFNKIISSFIGIMYGDNNKNINEEKLRTVDGLRKVLYYKYNEDFLSFDRFCEISEEERTSALGIINDFTYNAKEDKYDYSKIELLYDALLFDEKIPLDNIISLGNTLLSINLFNNDYYEYFKIKILDTILNRVNINTEKDMFLEKDVNIFLEKLNIYIGNNMVASHLIDTFTKIYLSYALYYSKDEKLDTDNIKKSKEFLSLYININGSDIKEEYTGIYNNILKNYGIFYAKETGLSENKLTNNDYIKIGNSIINMELELKSLKDQTLMTDELNGLIDKILLEDGIDDNKILKKITEVVGEHIFHGLTEIYVLGINKGFNDINNIEKGNDTTTLDIMGKFKLVFKYPKVYKNNFDIILDKNRIFLEKSLKNILINYIQNRNMYMDSITGLPNIYKLKKDINKYEDKSIIYFYEVNLGIVGKISKQLNHKQGDIVFRELAKTFKRKFNASLIYRLSGTRLGILVGDYENNDDIIDRILELKLTIGKNTYDLDANIGLAHGDKTNILEKSSTALNNAIKSGRTYEYNL